MLKDIQSTFSKLRSFFVKSDNLDEDFEKNNLEIDASKKVPDWFNDRYDTILTQKNILIIVACVLLVTVSSLSFVIYKVSALRSFEPFVIQVNERTGEAVVVNPVERQVMLANESLNHFFIRKYIIAREGYNPVDFELNSRRVVRLLSTSPIFFNYRSFIRNPNNDPTIIHARTEIGVRFRSISKMDERYFVRFSLTRPDGTVFKNRISTLTIDYRAVDLIEEDRMINPVGFLVTGYSVSDESD